MYRRVDDKPMPRPEGFKDGTCVACRRETARLTDATTNKALIAFELKDRRRGVREVARRCHASTQRVVGIRDELVAAGELPEPEPEPSARNPLPSPEERATVALRHDPDRTNTAIAEAADVSAATVRRTRRKLGLPRTAPPAPESRRRQILTTLSERGPMTAIQLGEALGAPATTVRKRLARLCADGLVTPEQDGRPGRNFVWRASADGS